MSEFYQGFWWCFPLFIIGFICGRQMRPKKIKLFDESWTMSWLMAWAILGMVSLFSGFPALGEYHGH
ncbi:hypothetical protein BEL05_04920 [Shewanella colwelliana]|uniref:Uncharacterized protein n=1 Tax=Shewanella colwelliana TaxID=23 RepID=A0A1E5IP55_SHECO|nr:hypothetical protein [Shewanella colwelliana]OEG72321.1 hypothetical protein BEL05_04920 [Shewanella colwelliana]